MEENVEVIRSLKLNNNMANLAIKGHSTRGKEVIEILEMLGGKSTLLTADIGDVLNPHVYFFDPDSSGNKIVWYYLLGLEHDGRASEMMIFTLEEFLENYPYKVGDKVLYKHDNTTYFIRKMFWENDKILYELSDEVYSDGCSIPDTLIFDIDAVKLRPYKEETFGECIEKTINECLFSKKETMEDNSILNQQLSELVKETELDSKTFADGYEQGYDDGQHDMTEWNLPDGFIFKDENGNVINANKIVLEKKKPKYPKTYEECCRVLGISDGEFMFNGLSEDEYDLFDSFVIIKRCRDAYWKIAGEEMGLGKPWEPDWENKENTKYCITTINRQIKTITTDVFNYFLAFPTPEMRDAFSNSEEISRLIENCKEFL